MLTGRQTDTDICTDRQTDRNTVLPYRGGVIMTWHYTVYQSTFSVRLYAVACKLSKQSTDQSKAYFRLIITNFTVHAF